MYNFQFQRNDSDVWEIKFHNTGFMTSEAALAHIVEFAIAEGFETTYVDLFGGNYTKMHSAMRLTVISKTDAGELVDTPAFFTSWMNIILDYAQSFVYVRSCRKFQAETGLNMKQNAEEIDRYGLDKVMAFSEYLSGTTDMFGDLTEKKKKKRKK